MNFTGTIYFNFGTYDVWRIYTILLKASQDRDVAVDVEWRAFTNEGLERVTPEVTALAVCESVRAAHPDKYDKFVRALLTLVYQERDKPGAEKTLAVAAHVAGIEGFSGFSGDPDLGLLRDSIAAARARGITDVPTIERQGPPVLIKTNAAANYGNATTRLRLIDHMIRDDGIWEMTKPS